MAVGTTLVSVPPVWELKRYILSADCQSYTLVIVMWLGWKEILLKGNGWWIGCALHISDLGFWSEAEYGELFKQSASLLWSIWVASIMHSRGYIFLSSFYKTQNHDFWALYSRRKWFSHDPRYSFCWLRVFLIEMSKMMITGWEYFFLTLVPWSQKIFKNLNSETANFQIQSHYLIYWREYTNMFRSCKWARHHYSYAQA